MTVGERIKKVRKDAKLTQKDFSERLGITQSTISKLETDNCNIVEQIIRQIASEFHVSIDWIKTGDGEPYIKSEAEIVKQLEVQYNLSDGQKKLLEMFLELPPSRREKVAVAFLGFFGIDVPEELVGNGAVDAEHKYNSKKVKAANQKESSHSVNGSMNTSSKKKDA